MSAKKHNPEILGLSYDPAAGSWEIWDGPFMVATAADENFARLIAAAPLLLNGAHRLTRRGMANACCSKVVFQNLQDAVSFVAKKHVRKAPAVTIICRDKSAKKKPVAQTKKEKDG